MRAASRTVVFLLGSLLAGCITAPHVSAIEKSVDTGATLGFGLEPAPVRDARLRAAQAVTYTTRAALGPNISYDADAARQRLSSHDTIPPQFDGAEIWKGHQELNFSQYHRTMVCQGPS